MSTQPRRRWLRFGLRTLFLALTAVAMFVAYHVNWIRQRHEMVAKQDKAEIAAAESAGERLKHHLPPDTEFPPIAPHLSQTVGQVKTRAPGLLWLFGEQGLATLRVWIEIDESGRPLPAYAVEIQKAQRLFPETKLLPYWEGLAAFPDNPLKSGPQKLRLD